MIHAVIDTNVIVSALLTHNIESATVKVVEAFLMDKIIPLYNADIINEYRDVLGRAKFRFTPRIIDYYINAIHEKGISAERISSGEFFPDPDDAVFYEVALSKEDAYLVTGNTKHFPKKPIVVTPAEMLEILESQER
ncbi:MAG: putative toxin-antitoxin system toxin component, PIN family [Bacteroidales bacterium]|nr:putative toxin-antitoxin system toxin component, PIN family [Bacteroidales bacterium]